MGRMRKRKKKKAVLQCPLESWAHPASNVTRGEQTVTSGTQKQREERPLPGGRGMGEMGRCQPEYQLQVTR